MAGNFPFRGLPSSGRRRCHSNSGVSSSSSYSCRLRMGDESKECRERRSRSRRCGAPISSIKSSGRWRSTSGEIPSSAPTRTCAAHKQQVNSLSPPFLFFILERARFAKASPAYTYATFVPFRPFSQTRIYHAGEMFSSARLTQTLFSVCCSSVHLMNDARSERHKRADGQHPPNRSGCRIV